MVQLSLGDLSEIEGLLRRDVLQVLLPICRVLVDFVEEVDVLEGVPLVGDEDSVDVLQVESDGRRPPPHLFLVVKIVLAEDPIHGGVVGPANKNGLILDLVGLPLDDLEAVIQLQDQGLILLRFQHDPLHKLLQLGGGLAHAVPRCKLLVIEWNYF